MLIQQHQLETEETLQQVLQHLQQKLEREQEVARRTREIEEKIQGVHHQVSPILSHITCMQYTHTLESTICTFILCTVCTTAVCVVSLMTAIIVQEKIKDVPVSGSEGVEMEEHEAGSSGGEDPSSFQLTTADSECVLLYTVNTTHCTHALL